MEELVQTQNVLPEEYKVIQRVRDLWANHINDDEIRELLQLNTQQWEALMRMMKEINFTEGDNHIAFEKFRAKQQKRSKELERLRIYAEGQDELGTAVKCFQLEADIDKSLIDVGVKLSVLKGEVIQVDVNTKTDVRLQHVFADLTPQIKEEAKNDLNDLAQMLLAEGIKLTENGESEPNTGKA